MSLEAAERAVQDADPEGALRLLQAHVRAHPSDARPRIFLFQLLSVLGQWDRAHTQLNVAAELDAGALAMAQMYREALQCEALRADVFSGRKAPLILGEPDAWVAWLIESLTASAEGGAGASQHARELRERAFEAAPATPGSIDGVPFTWIADADMRLGPVCEAVINGRYYWVPFARLSRIDLEPPVDLRDVVWTPAHLAFANGGDSVCVIPTRYSGSESAAPGLRLARLTEWLEVAPEVFHGLGQRVLATDAGEYPLMDVRSIVLGAAADEASEAARA